MKLIGYLLLARMHVLCAIGRAAYRIACRYGQAGGLGGVFAVAAYERRIRERYGIKQPAQPSERAV